MGVTKQPHCSHVAEHAVNTQHK